MGTTSQSRANNNIKENNLKPDSKASRIADLKGRIFILQNAANLH